MLKFTVLNMIGGSACLLLGIAAAISESLGNSNITKLYRKIRKKELIDEIPPSHPRIKTLTESIMVLTGIPTAAIGIYSLGREATSLLFPPPPDLCESRVYYDADIAAGISGVEQFLRKCPESPFNGDAARQYRHYVHHEFEIAKACMLAHACHPSSCLLTFKSLNETDSDMDVSLDITVEFAWLEENAANVVKSQCVEKIPMPSSATIKGKGRETIRPDEVLTRPIGPASPKISQDVRNKSVVERSFTLQTRVAVIAPQGETSYLDKNAAITLRDTLSKTLHLVEPEDASLLIEIFGTDSWATPTGRPCPAREKSIYSGWSGVAHLTMQVKWRNGATLRSPSTIQSPALSCDTDEDTASRLALANTVDAAREQIVALIRAK